MSTTLKTSKTLKTDPAKQGRPRAAYPDARSSGGTQGRPDLPCSMICRVALINAEHRKCREAIRSGIQYAIRCGELLIEAKAGIPHGGWSKWVADNCEFSARTARAYMQVARLPEEKRQRTAHLSFRGTLKLLASPSEKPNLSDIDACIEAMYRVESFRELCTISDAMLVLSNAKEFGERAKKALESKNPGVVIQILNEAQKRVNQWSDFSLQSQRKAGDLLIQQGEEFKSIFESEMGGKLLNSLHTKRGWDNFQKAMEARIEQLNPSI